MSTHTQTKSITDYTIGILGSPDPLINEFFSSITNKIVYCNPVKFSLTANKKYKKLPLHLLSIIKLLNKLVYSFNKPALQESSQDSAPISSIGKFSPYEIKPRGFLIFNSNLLYHNRFDVLLKEYVAHIPNGTKTCLFSYNNTKWSANGKATCPWVWERTPENGLCKLNPQYTRVIDNAYSFWISLEHAKELIEEGLSLNKTIDQWLITDSSIFTYPLMTKNKNSIFNGWTDKYNRLDYRPGLILKKIVSTDIKGTVKIEITN